jgi:hypothetical protein
VSNQPPINIYTTEPQPPQKNNTLLIILILAGVGFFALICCGILAGLLLPAVNQARTAARKMSDANSIRSIGIAMLEYEQSYRVLPPAYTVDAAGNKLHSWRTLLLPYLGQTALYQQIDFSKPWDAPENAKFHSAMPEVFNTASTTLPAGETLYRVILHPRGVFTGPDQTTYSSIIDGAANTIMIVQAAKNQSVSWMQPDEYTVSDFMKVDKTNALYFDGYTHIITPDGSVKAIGIQQLGSQMIESMVIIDDGGPAAVRP